ncbi:MAG: hypothetical protein HY077_04885 [Elusimicrobia bacterium]|nr:hypothetical protein [Elusimicrobiota bacterium]
MKPLFLRLLLVFSLARPAAAGNRATPELPGEGQAVPGGKIVSPGTPPVQIDLKVAPLNTIAVDAVKTVETPAADAALSQVQLPVLEPAPGLIVGPKPEASPEFTPPARGPAPSVDGQVVSGRAQFDLQTAKYAPAPPAPSFTGWLSALWTGADKVPDWPGKAGDKVRLDGKTYVLERRIGEGNSAIVWRARNGGHDVAVKFIHPAFKNIPQYGEEVSALEAIAHTDIRHAKLLAKGADGLVLVKEFVDGEKASELLARGALLRSQREGYMELAARLIRIGYTGDIHPNNLIWEKWRSRYALADVGGFEFGRPWAVLSQILEGPPVKSGEVKAVEFLSGLRGRLGPDSDGWRRVQDDAAQTPALARHLAELSAYDRSLKPAPRLRLGPAKEEAVLSNALVSASELRKRLGYDPLLVKPRHMLHGDDPGKLNTVVFQIDPNGMDSVVVKIAEKDIIRHELAMRRIVRRFFGQLFRTPGALAIDGGHESYMVMSLAKGSKSYSSDAMDLEHRVAMAMLSQTFGLYDVNQGNVLSLSKSDVALIDFEQAFGRRAPLVSRLPDERIAQEMPWVSLHEKNRIEDYLPAIKSWRGLFLKPETQVELVQILRQSGFSDKEIPGYLAQFRANADDLEWAIQNDVEFANLFVERRSSR